MARESHPFFASRRRPEGFVTLVALCLLTTLGIALAGYIALSQRSAQLGARLVNREKAQQLAQIGLEEALWALNQNTWSSSGPTGTTTWSTSGANRTVTLSYPFTDASASGQVALSIGNYASTGPVWPTITANATVTTSGGETFTKSVQATTGPAPLFSNAIASSDSYVSFVQSGTVDSWNSDPDNDSSTAAVAYSFTAGDATNYNAVVAGKTNGTYGVILTQATVRGYVATFGDPISYSTSGSPPAKVLGPTTAASVNVDSTRLGKSAFVPITDVFSVTPPSTTGANYGGLLNNIVTLATDLLGGSSTTDVYKSTTDITITGVPLLAPSVVIDRPIKWIIDGDLHISSFLVTKGNITVTSTGSLQLFVTGDVTIEGDGFRNLTNDPRKLAIFCTSDSTSDSLEYNTAKDFCGVIFCEHKPIDIKQNGPFYGALLSRQAVRFIGSATSPTFHYDMALRQATFSGITTPYVVKQVTEL